MDYDLPSERLRIGGDRYTASEPDMHCLISLNPFAIWKLAQTSLIVSTGPPGFVPPRSSCYSRGSATPTQSV